MPEVPDLSVELLGSAIERGDLAEVERLLRGRSERERRSLAPALVAQHAEPSGQQEPHGWGPLLGALIGCATLRELQKLKVPPPSGELNYRILVDRRPAWLSAWVDHLLVHGRHGTWVVCRRLVKDGLIARPEGDAYIVVMLTQWRHHFDDLEPPYSPEKWRGTYKTPHDALLADPELLEHEVWQVFNERAATAKALDGWSASLARLAEEGHLSRERLLRACLQALYGDITSFQVKWYKELHGRLGPSAAEKSTLEHLYTRLLSHRESLTVQTALENLAELEQMGCLTGERFIAEVDAALVTMPKVTALRALRLLTTVLKNQPQARSSGVVAATAALSHAHEAVRKAAMALIEQYYDECGTDARQAVLAFVGVDPPLDRKLVALAGRGEPPSS